MCKQEDLHDCFCGSWTRLWRWWCRCGAMLCWLSAGNIIAASCFPRRRAQCPRHVAGYISCCAAGLEVWLGGVDKTVTGAVEHETFKPLVSSYTY
jgi:hypothetical protein